nr:hypothetical protein [Prolixibacteraceae bacterium]
MKNFTLSLLTFAVAFLFVCTVQAQDEGTTYSDDFSAQIDYLSSGVSGTIWEGILLNNNVWDAGETVAEITKLNTTEAAGALTFSTMNSHWAIGMDCGAALYRTVKNGADFEAQVKITDGQYLSLGYERCDYLMSGIIAKVK